MLVAVAGAIQAQSWDTSGNGLLEGQYYFRQVSYDVSDKYGDLGGEIGIYGNITFDGNGKYSMTGQYNICLLYTSRADQGVCPTTSAEFQFGES